MVLPAGIWTPPRVVVFSASRNVPLIGLSIRSVSSMNRGISARFSPQPPLQPGLVADQPQGRAQQPDGGLLAGREQVGRDPGHVERLGQRAVRKGRPGHPGQHVTLGFYPELLDALGEVAVEEVERVVGHPLLLA